MQFIPFGGERVPCNAQARIFIQRAYMMGLFFLLLIGLVIYLVPSIVAGERKHDQTMAIVALNIFAGWT
jgi:Superinfection immunity protein